jgi:putative glutamine amidotransferase
MAAVSKRIASVIWFSWWFSGKGSKVASDGHTQAGYIAVVGQWKRGTEFAKLPVTYVESVRLAGGRSKALCTFPLEPGERIAEHLDAVADLDPHDPSPLDGAAGLLLPGGGDIDPAWYGAEPHPRTRGISHRRDRFELTLLERALSEDMPVLAICKGMQLLNVHLGGTLDQHIADVAERFEHDRDRVRADAAHKLQVERDSKLGEIIGTDPCDVNSHHHQGLDSVALALREVGWAEDGVLEAVESREHNWVIGVQWHPEVMTPMDHLQLAIFEAFVEAAHAFARQPALRVPS